MISPLSRRASGVAATLLGLAVHASAAAAPGQDASPVRGVIPLYQSDNRVLVMMQIGDGDLSPMVFDTGSDGNSIDQTLVARHNLRRVGTVIEVDGTTLTQRSLPSVAVENVALGGLRFTSLEATALDYDRTDAMGIISSEMFTGSLVSLELARNRVRLLPPESTPPHESAPVAHYEGLPTIEVALPDGSTLPAHFDTGYNAALSLPLSLIDKVPLDGPARVIGRFNSINTEGDVYGGRLRGCVQIGPVMMKDPQISFLGEITNIGLPVIRLVTLVIDPANKRSWTLAADVAPPSTLAQAQGAPTVGRCPGAE